MLGRLFLKPSIEALQAKARALQDDGEFGQAKLVYEQIQERVAEDPEQAKQTSDAINSCLDGIAEQRIRRARELFDAKSRDFALEELVGALEVAVSEAVRSKAARLRDELERSDAVASATADGPTESEELALVTGSLEDEQADEYAEYGAPLTSALLALSRGQASAALESLREILDAAEAPRYLWFELGRALLAQTPLSDEHRAEAVEALRRFLELLGEHESVEPRLMAHRLLAQVALDQGQDEDAVSELENAAAELPDDPRAYLELARVLRLSARAPEAVEVLELAVDAIDHDPPWQLLGELGLALKDAGHSAAAISTLEGVVEMFSARRVYDLPPAIATPLADLHSEAGQRERAADLYRALAHGSDHRQHAWYHLRAGELLWELGLEQEARSMLTRAEALVEHREDGQDGSPLTREQRERLTALLNAAAPDR